MKKIVFALVVLMFTAPAWAQVDIYCTDLGEGKILVSFDATMEPNLVRAFGLDFQCDNDANIGDVNDNINPDYWVFPGTIQIDAGGTVTYPGTAVAEYDDLQSDTMKGPPDSNMTIEMGSLYYPPDPTHANAPAAYGPLLTFTVDKNTCITISGNVARAGNTGVVMEDPDDDPTVNFPLVTECCVVLVTDANEGTAWDMTLCSGQPSGDADCDGVVGLGDLSALRAAWGGIKGDGKYHCGADFDHDGVVGLGDLSALRGGWGNTGYVGTGEQSCPP